MDGLDLISMCNPPKFQLYPKSNNILPHESSVIHSVKIQEKRSRRYEKIKEPSSYF